MLFIPNLPEPLSRAICADLIRNLPLLAEDTPEQRALRDERAIAVLAHYLPENAAEAELAADIVAAEFHAKDALRGANLYFNDIAATDRCRRQHALMMRTMQSGLRTLQRMQAERRKAEHAMHPAAMERAGYWFKAATVPEPEPPAPPPGPVEPPCKEFAAMTPAEQYVTLYPERAAPILALRGLPARLTFPPPEPDVLQELLSGTSPLIQAFAQREQLTAAPA